MRAFLSLGLVFTAAVTGCREGSTGSTGSTAPAPNPTPEASAPDWREAFSHQVRYEPNDRAVVVDVRLAPGFHAYTTGETTGKPLKVELDPDSAYQLDGPVRYPKGVEKTLPLGKSVIVEGQTKVVAKIAPRSPEATGPAKGSFHYQVCTDKACDRPRKAPFEVAVNP